MEEAGDGRPGRRREDLWWRQPRAAGRCGRRLGKVRGVEVELQAPVIGPRCYEEEMAPAGAQFGQQEDERRPNEILRSLEKLRRGRGSLGAGAHADGASAEEGAHRGRERRRGS